MELFIDKYLKDHEGKPKYKFIKGIDGRAQKIFHLYRDNFFEDVTTYDYDHGTRYAPWDVDVNGDALLEPYMYTRTPLEVTYKISGKQLTVIGMHTKSKYIHDGESAWNNDDRRLAFVKEALLNRRRISAEAMHTRVAVNEIMRLDPDRAIIVLGDMNDGPGRDYFEEKYLTYNVTDILLGSTFYPERMFFHALNDLDSANRYTAIFDDFITGENQKKVLLDHILCSPNTRDAGGAFMVKPDSGIVEHAIYNDSCSGTEREQIPSDHRPISIVLQY
jgi:hypothetical protein